MPFKYENAVNLKLNQPSIPHHLAVIMDGNSRWAVVQGVSRYKGHLAGKEVAFQLIDTCLEQGVSILTLFVLSQDNLIRRSRLEIKYLFDILSSALEAKLDDLIEKQICLRVLGDRTGLPASLCDVLNTAETATAHLKKMRLNLALNYSGHWHITQCVQHFIEQSHMTPNLLDSFSVSDVDAWMTDAMPAPDLLIRTGREHRLSNFLLWQCAYTELFFSEVLWPDFTPAHLAEAFDWFKQRQRRFGGRIQQEAMCDE